MISSAACDSDRIIVPVQIMLNRCVSLALCNIHAIGHQSVLLEVLAYSNCNQKKQVQYTQDLALSAKLVEFQHMTNAVALTNRANYSIKEIQKQ